MSAEIPDVFGPGFTELNHVAVYGYARYPAATAVKRPEGWTGQQWEAFAEELRAACEEPDATC